MKNIMYNQFIDEVKKKRTQISIDNKLPHDDWKNEDYDLYPASNPFLCFYFNENNELILNTFIINIKYNNNFKFNKKNEFYKMLDSNKNFKILIDIFNQVFKSHNLTLKKEQLIDIIDINTITLYKNINDYYDDDDYINEYDIPVYLKFSLVIPIKKLKKFFDEVSS